MVAERITIKTIVSANRLGFRESSKSASEGESKPKELAKGSIRKR